MAADTGAPRLTSTREPFISAHPVPASRHTPGDLAHSGAVLGDGAVCQLRHVSAKTRAACLLRQCCGNRPCVRCLCDKGFMSISWLATPSTSSFRQYRSLRMLPPPQSLAGIALIGGSIVCYDGHRSGHSSTSVTASLRRSRHSCNRWDRMLEVQFQCCGHCHVFVCIGVSGKASCPLDDATLQR